MGYVDDSLLSVESVVCKAKIHWVVFIPGIFLFVTGILLVRAASGGRAGAVRGVMTMGAGICKLSMALIYKFATELAGASKGARQGWLYQQERGGIEPRSGGKVCFSSDCFRSAFRFWDVRFEWERWWNDVHSRHGRSARISSAGYAINRRLTGGRSSVIAPPAIEFSSRARSEVFFPRSRCIPFLLLEIENRSKRRSSQGRISSAPKQKPSRFFHPRERRAHRVGQKNRLRPDPNQDRSDGKRATHPRVVRGAP